MTATKNPAWVGQGLMPNLRGCAWQVPVSWRPLGGGDPCYLPQSRIRYSTVAREGQVYLRSHFILLRSLFVTLRTITFYCSLITFYYSSWRRRQARAAP
jgi:hypothetical protein